MKLESNTTKNSSDGITFGKAIPLKRTSENMAEKLPDFLQKMIDGIGKCVREEDSDILLHHLSTINDDFAKLETNSYKYYEYYVNAMFNSTADSRVKTLKKLNQQKLDIVPQFVDSVQKENTTYLITKINGTQNGNLIPFEVGYNLLSNDAKKNAYNDIRKMLKLGINNVAMSRSTKAWYITPDNHRVVVPNWEYLDLINKQNDRQNLLSSYYNKLFKE